MLDTNTIMEIVNTSMPIIASSPVAIKLISVVENVLKTLYIPALTLKKGKAEVDVEIYRQQKNNELLNNQTFTLYEITKLKNFINTAQYASEELENDNSEYSDEQVDFDWIMRFFDAVGNISNVDMQKLWGKVLAGEIKQPGICSLRTLDIIRNMSAKEAQTYNELCKYVLTSGDCYFILSNGFYEFNADNTDTYMYMKNKELNFSDNIMPMIESGLISVTHNLATNFSTCNILKINNDQFLCLIISKGPNDEKDRPFEIEAYFLTTSGIELYNIIKNTSDFKSNLEYHVLCFRELKRDYPDLSISAYQIIDDDTSDDLL